MRASDPHIGSDLLGYEIEEVIGRGGMGVVYRARDRALERNVALKLIAPEYAGFTGFRGRFLAESRLAASLEHPNVVPIYAGGGSGRPPLYRDAVHRGPRSQGDPARRCSDARAGDRDLSSGRKRARRRARAGSRPPRRQALEHPDRRERSGVPRRLRPSRLSSDPAKASEIAASLGTIDYVAPEQIRGDAIDGRADVYSLGCVLYECLTGSAPFSIRSDVALLYAHLEEEPPAAPGLEDVVAKALAKDPEARYSTCGELVEAAADALGVSHERRSRWPLLVVAAVARHHRHRRRGGTARPRRARQPRRCWGCHPRLARTDGTIDPDRPRHRKRSRHDPDRRRADGCGGRRRRRVGLLVPQRRSLEGRSGLWRRHDDGPPIGGLALAATNDAVYAVFDGLRHGTHLFRTRRQPVAPRCDQERRSAPRPIARRSDPGRDRTGRCLGHRRRHGVPGRPSWGYVDQAVHQVPIPTIDDDENGREPTLGSGGRQGRSLGDRRCGRSTAVAHRHLPSGARPDGHGAWVRPCGRCRRIRPCLGDRSDHEQAIQDRSRDRSCRADDPGRSRTDGRDRRRRRCLGRERDRRDHLEGRPSNWRHRPPIFVGGSPTDVSFGDGSVWVVADAS